MEIVRSLAVRWREQVGIKHRQGRDCSRGVKTSQGARSEEMKEKI